jgi:hypothetical protein
VKYAVRRFKSLKLALREIEPFVRNGAHLQTGKAFKQLGDMRSREILANLLLCITKTEVEGADVTFSSDPVGDDGIIQDVKTGETWPTEHVMVPRHAIKESNDAKTLILNAIEQKQQKGGEAYAGGKTLVVFLDAPVGEWKPNALRETCPTRCYSRLFGWLACEASRTANTFITLLVWILAGAMHQPFSCALTKLSTAGM